MELVEEEKSKIESSKIVVDNPVSSLYRWNQFLYGACLMRAGIWTLQEIC